MERFTCICEKQILNVSKGKATAPCPMCGRRYIGEYSKEQKKVIAKELKPPFRILKQDILIPAGTVLTPAPTKTVRVSNDQFSVTFGLTDNSFGEFTYGVDADDKELDRYFEK